MEFISVKQSSFLRVLSHWGVGHALEVRMEGLFIPRWGSRFGLGRRKGLCFGEASTDEREDTSLSIYYQAILSSWRKALAFLICNDSHLRSISFSHFVTPTWKEMFIRWLICKGASEERWCVDEDPPLLFFRVGACDTQLFQCCGEAATESEKHSHKCICHCACSFHANCLCWKLGACKYKLTYTCFRHCTLCF